jgi:glutaredoxin 3
MISTEKVLIFGHDLCPYTSRAREDFSRRKIPFEYLNVLQNDQALQQMLKHSKGRRQIPVIVEAGEVTIGFQGS